VQRCLDNQKAGEILLRQVAHDVPEFLAPSDKVLLWGLASTRKTIEAMTKYMVSTWSIKSSNINTRNFSTRNTNRTH
jgi:hypothetical protein